MDNFLILIVLIGSITGFTILLVGVILAISDIYKYFTFTKAVLTPEEVKRFEEAINEDISSTHKFLNEYASKKSFSWKDYRYNKATQELKIR